MKLKILLVPSVSYPTHDSQLGEVYANILPDKGHKIKWVMQSNKKSDKNKMVYWNNTCVYLIPPFINKTSFFRILINLIFTKIKKMRTTIRLIKSEKFDVFQVYNGIWDGLLGIYIKKRYGLAFFYHMPSVFPEEKLQAYKMRTGSYHPLIYYIRGKLEQLILYNCILHKTDLILAISEWMKKELIRKGIDEEKIVVFPMGVNISSPPSGEAIKEKLKLGKSPTLIYIGTILNIRQLDFLLRSLVMVKKKIPDVKLLMVGDGNDRNRLEKLSQSLNLKQNVIFTGWVSRFQIPDYIASADIGVSFVPPFPIFQISSPTKLVEYMAVGKAVVGNDIPDQKEVIGDSGGGICVPYDEKEFANAIMELLDNPDKAKEMGKLGYQYVQKNRSYEVLANKLEPRYFDVLMDNEKGI